MHNNSLIYVELCTDKIIICKDYDDETLCALSRYDGSFIVSVNISSLFDKDIDYDECDCYMNNDELEHHTEYDNDKYNELYNLAKDFKNKYKMDDNDLLFFLTCHYFIEYVEKCTKHNLISYSGIIECGYLDSHYEKNETGTYHMWTIDVNDRFSIVHELNNHTIYTILDHNKTIIESTEADDFGDGDGGVFCYTLQNGNLLLANVGDAPSIILFKINDLYH